MVLVVQAIRHAEVAQVERQVEIAHLVRPAEMVLVVPCFHECFVLCLLL